jgi:hypothetical protein
MDVLGSACDSRRLGIILLMCAYLGEMAKTKFSEMRQLRLHERR